MSCFSKSTTVFPASSGRGSDADGVVAAQHADACDVAARDGHLHEQVVVVAHSRAYPFAVGEAVGHAFLLRFGVFRRVVARRLRRRATRETAQCGDAAECERPREKVPAIEFHSVAPSSIGRRGFVIAVPRRNEQREYRQARLSESTPIIGAGSETDGFRLAHFRLFFASCLVNVIRI